MTNLNIHSCRRSGRGRWQLSDHELISGDLIEWREDDTWRCGRVAWKAAPEQTTIVIVIAHKLS